MCAGGPLRRGRGTRAALPAWGTAGRGRPACLSSSCCSVSPRGARPGAAGSAPGRPGRAGRCWAGLGPATSPAGNEGGPGPWARAPRREGTARRAVPASGAAEPGRGAALRGAAGGRAAPPARRAVPSPGWPARRRLRSLPARPGALAAGAALRAPQTAPPPAPAAPSKGRDADCCRASPRNFKGHPQSRDGACVCGGAAWRGSPVRGVSTGGWGNATV